MSRSVDDKPVDALAAAADEGTTALSAPEVGLWRDAPPLGAVLAPGDSLGAIETLGVVHPLAVPSGAAGAVVEIGGDDARARRPVGYGSLLVRLDPTQGGAAVDVAAAADAAETADGLVFRAPSSGRFYARPSPDRPMFVAVGDIVESGQAVAILEVMKMFSRIPYGGPGLPDKARVERIVPADGDDLEEGDPILVLAPIDG